MEILICIQILCMAFVMAFQYYIGKEMPIWSFIFAIPTIIMFICEIFAILVRTVWHKVFK